MNTAFAFSCNMRARFICTINTSKHAVAPTETPNNKSTHSKYREIDDANPAGWNKALPYKSIPGPKPLPIIGNLWRVFSHISDLDNIDVLEQQKKLYKQYGKIVLLGGIPTLPDMIFLFAPEDFEMVHRNEGVFPIRDAFKAFKHYRTVIRDDIFQGIGGLVTVQGKDWHNIRSKINPILMQPRTIQQYADSMNVIANDFLVNVKQFVKSDPNREMPNDFLNHIYRWSLESVAYVALDRRLGCLDPSLRNDSEPQKIIDSVMRMFYLFDKLETMPAIWKVYSTKSWKEYVKVLDTMTCVFLKYIDEAKERIKDDLSSKPEHEMSVFQRLLKIDQRLAMAMAMDMITAGVDTTGRTTGVTLYYLAKNADVQNILRKELCSLMPTKDTPVSNDVLSNANYLKAVIKETHRIAPIAVGNVRQAIKDMVLCGYQVPKGTNIFTSNLLLCHSEEHFPQAKKFIPERWLRTTTGEISYKNSHPFVSLPFGFGPRSCVGKKLAHLELQIIVAKIVRNFTLEWHRKDMTFTSFPLYGIADPLKLQLKELEL